MDKFVKCFGKEKVIVGMIHILALPATPNYCGSVEKIIETAIEESKIYKKNGIDAILIENMHDRPYLNKNTSPEVTAIMSVIGREVKKVSGLPCGIQILAGINKEALAAAQAANMDFIRSEGFVFAHVADEGIINSDAGELLRYRKQIGAENILIFTDIKKKHSSHAITNDVSIKSTAHAAEFFLSDGLIVTGEVTGKEASLEELKIVKESVNIPVLVGSGVTYDNIEKYFSIADALIIGTSLKVDGNWENIVDGKRVAKIMKKVRMQESGGRSQK